MNTTDWVTNLTFSSRTISTTDHTYPKTDSLEYSLAFSATTPIHTLLLFSYYTHLIEACFFTPILPILQRAQEDGVYNTVDTVAYFARLSGAYGTSLLRDSPSPSAHAPPPPGPPQHTGHVPLYSTSLS